MMNRYSKLQIWTLVVWCILLTNISAQSEEDIGLKYVLQYAEMHRYMALMVGTESEERDNLVNVRDFEMIFAYREGSAKEKTAQRFESVGTWISSNDERRNVDERVLLVGGKEWTERGGDIVDLSEDARKEKGVVNFTKVALVDPFALPVSYTNSLLLGGANRDNLDLMMPHGRFLQSVEDGLGGTAAVWLHGREKDLGITEILFDEKSGGMPVSCKIRIRKKGAKNGVIDKNDPYGSSMLYSLTEIKWQSTSAGVWLPFEIDSKEVANSPSAYNIKIYWWLDRDVPNSIFELDDFKLASIRNSVVNELVEKRKQSKKMPHVVDPPPADAP